MLCVHEIVQHELFDAVADRVHAAGPLEVIGGFEFFRDALDLDVQPDEVVVHLPCVLVEVDQVLLDRSIHTHYGKYLKFCHYCSIYIVFPTIYMLFITENTEVQKELQLFNQGRRTPPRYILFRFMQSLSV